MQHNPTSFSVFIAQFSLHAVKQSKNGIKQHTKNTKQLPKVFKQTTNGIKQLPKAFKQTTNGTKQLINRQKHRQSGNKHTIMSQINSQSGKSPLKRSLIQLNEFLNQIITFNPSQVWMKL